MNERVSRAEFLDELDRLAEALPLVKSLLTQLPDGFEGWPKHLKKDAYFRLGLEPLDLFNDPPETFVRVAEFDPHRKRQT